MEKPHQEFRDELAEKLKEIRKSDSKNPETAKAKAEGYLEAKKETEEYKDAQKKHKKEVVEYIMENATAEERLDTVWSEIKKPPFTKEQLLEALKAIDDIYESGFSLTDDLEFHLGWLHDEFSEFKEFGLGSVDEYDWDAMTLYLDKLKKSLNGVVTERYSLPVDSSHVDRIFECRGDHNFCVIPSTYDCDKDNNYTERVASFVKKFQKTPNI